MKFFVVVDLLKSRVTNMYLAEEANFRTEKRANPSLQQYSYFSGSSGVYRDVTAAVDRAGGMGSAIEQFGFAFDANGTTAGNAVAVGWTADCEL